MRFDFLHPEKRVWIPAIPREWRGFSMVAAACAAVLTGVVRIESLRLTSAVELQTAYEQRLQQTDTIEHRRSAAYRRLRTLTGVVREAAHVAGTSRLQARLITDLAQALPPHVWLSAIRRDDTGLTVQGKAFALSGLAELVRNLSRSNGVSHPQLTSVTRPETAIAVEPMTYALHVDVASKS